MADQKLARRGLARRLVWSFSAFVLFATLGIAVWLNKWFQQRALDELRDLTATNVEFITELRLPTSPDLARQLAHILDLGVGFHFLDGAEGDWPPELNTTIHFLAALDEPAATRVGKYEVGVAPFADDDVSLILVRETEPLSAKLAGAVLGPALLFTVACAVLAFWIGRGIVGPIGRLVNWLPHLEAGPDQEPPPKIDPEITGRSDEIGALAHALETTSEQLRHEQNLRQQSERLATLGRIATSLAHEIKNPAAAIGLHAELLAAKVDEDGAESVALIGEEVERITDLINQWLFVARSQPGRKEPHDLKTLADNVGRRLAPVLEHAHARLTINAAEDATFPVEVDAPRIEQALRNLIMNAAQAMPEGGEIRVDLKSGPEFVTVTVADQGTGFSEMALERFGEPFFSEREGGMGIGLTLAREVFQAHAGSLEPDRDHSGPGARVVCQLPKEEGDA